MNSRGRVAVLLGETKIDEEEGIQRLSDTCKDVVRFYVSMDEITRVDVFEPRDLFGLAMRVKDVILDVE